MNEVPIVQYVKYPTAESFLEDISDGCSKYKM